MKHKYKTLHRRLVEDRPTWTPRSRAQQIEHVRILWKSALKLYDLPNTDPLWMEKARDVRMLIESWNKKQAPLIPITRIPNVQDFKVKVCDTFHPIFKQHGILKREHKPTLIHVPGRNRAANRYLHHMFLRLNRQVSHPDLFWRTAEHLLNRSQSYLGLCVKEVEPTWYKSEKIARMKSSVWFYRTQLDLQNYTYKHLEIPKDPKDPRKAIECWESLSFIGGTTCMA